MLTPTDVHFLVGFLSSVGQPADVDLELGSMVMDSAAKKRRDVDVTVTRRSLGSVDCIKGIEVKAETRPLDVQPVEQLCSKLNDMPDLTSRSIVSASGFSDTARRKAERHGVELLRLDEWDQAKHPLPTHIEDGMTFTMRTLEWKSTRLDFDVDSEGRSKAGLTKRARLKYPTNREPLWRTLEALGTSVAEQVLNARRQEPGTDDLPDGELIPVEYNVQIPERPEVFIRRKRIGTVRGAILRGTASWRSKQHQLHFKILLRDRDDAPYVACLIADADAFGLVGIALQTVPAPLTIFRIPISDRNLKVIRQRKIPRR